MKIRIALLPAALLLCTACYSPVVPAPSNLLSVDWNFADADAEMGIPGPNFNLDSMGVQVQYEFLPFGGGANVVVGYLYRDSELKEAVGSPSFITHTVKIGPRYHYWIEEPFSVYAGPNIGLVVANDTGDMPGTDYGVSFYWDIETGIRWQASEQFGIQGSVNYSVAYMQADNPVTVDATLSGWNFSIGAFIDF